MLHFPPAPPAPPAPSPLRDLTLRPSLNLGGSWEARPFASRSRQGAAAEDSRGRASGAGVRRWARGPEVGHARCRQTCPGAGRWAQRPQSPRPALLIQVPHRPPAVPRLPAPHQQQALGGGASLEHVPEGGPAMGGGSQQARGAPRPPQSGPVPARLRSQSPEPGRPHAGGQALHPCLKARCPRGTGHRVSPGARAPLDGAFADAIGAVGSVRPV